MAEPSALEHFRKLLAAADTAAQTITSIHVKDLDPAALDSYPDLTVIKIERQSTVEFRAAVALLHDPILAYGAEILGRSLIEGAGQMWRIYGRKNSSVVSRRRRAICFEFGSISSQKRALDPSRRDGHGRRLPSNLRYSSKEARASTRQRYRDTADLHRVLCPAICRGVSSSQISDSILNMSRRHKELQWAYPLYEIGSMASHQTLLRPIASSDWATMAVVDLGLEDRCSILDRLLVSYGITVELAGRIHMPGLRTFQAVAVALKQGMNELRARLKQDDEPGRA